MREKLRGGEGLVVAVILMIAFVALKLSHVINFSWLWVLSPIGMLIILFAFVWLCLALYGDDHKDHDSIYAEP